LVLLIILLIKLLNVEMNKDKWR